MRTPSTSDSLAFPVSSWANGNTFGAFTNLTSAASGFTLPTTPSVAAAPAIPPAPAWQPTVGTIPSSTLISTSPTAAKTISSGVGPVAFLPSGLIADDDEDDDDDDDDILAPHLRNLADAPQPPDGAAHPSMGSDGHEGGTCKRCCFFPRGRCTNGYNCEFCHFDHEKRKRKNKKKKKKAGAEGQLIAQVGPPG